MRLIENFSLDLSVQQRRPRLHILLFKVSIVCKKIVKVNNIKCNLYLYDDTYVMSTGIFSKAVKKVTIMEAN